MSDFVFDHVGITVADIDVVTAFFVALGLEVEGRTFVEGEFLDTVCGIPDSRTEIVMLRSPDDGAGLELARFVRPDAVPGSPAAMANELGLRNVAFEVDDVDLDAELLRDRLAEIDVEALDRVGLRVLEAERRHVVLHADRDLAVQHHRRDFEGLRVGHTAAFHHLSLEAEAFRECRRLWAAAVHEHHGRLVTDLRGNQILHEGRRIGNLPVRHRLRTCANPEVPDIGQLHRGRFTGAN